MKLWIDMMRPLFFPVLGGIVFLLALWSFVCPDKWAGKTHEYLKFFFCSIGSFWLLYMIGRLVVTGYRWKDLFLSERWLLILLFAWITITHLIYPFKKVERNRYFTIASLSVLMIGIVLTAIAWIGMASNN